MTDHDTPSKSGPPSAAALDVDAVARCLTEVFARIERERMQGLPILHPDLSVEVVGARAWHGDWLGVLITPWCMNLILVPGPESRHVPGSTGTELTLSLPAGRFGFIASFEDDIGPFGACSLFSPMNDFLDQAGAVATARAVMSELLDPAPPASEPAAVDAGPGISRRELLRGQFARRR
jgi:[NiFe] hydrogenase assembly HybE family chaperone